MTFQNVMESGRLWPQGFIDGKKLEFGTKKQFLRIATRYEKLAANYTAMIT